VPPNRKRIGIRAPADAWKHLGELLEAHRRVELGYRSRGKFAAGRLPPTPSGNANVRLVSDIENSYRPDTYPAGTLRQIAGYYGVAYESMLAVLHGEADKLIPAEPVPPSMPSARPLPAATAGGHRRRSARTMPPLAGPTPRTSGSGFTTSPSTATPTPRALTCSARAPTTPAAGMTRACGSYIFSASAYGTSLISAAARPAPNDVHRYRRRPGSAIGLRRGPRNPPHSP
jgi:hypothetical protein